MAPPKKTRITLDLSPSLYGRLEGLEERLGYSSKADVIRESLRLMGFVCDRVDQGDRVQALDKDGNVETIVLLGVGCAGASKGEKG